MIRKNIFRAQKGQILLVTMVLLTVFFIILSLALTSISYYAGNEKYLVASAQALYTAEGGIDYALYQLNNNSNYTGEINKAFGNGAFDVIITNINSSNKNISVTAYIPSSTNPIATKTVKVNTGIGNSVNPNFYYGVQAGEGGVAMGQNSKIQGAGGISGNFYSNGSVNGDNGATITGDVIVATGISLDTQNTVCNTDQIIGKTNPQIDFAQSFEPSQSKPLGKISLYIKKVGNPGNRTIKITSDSSGSPTTSSLALATLDSSLVTTSYGWIDVIFSSPPSLTANTTYWIVFDADQDNNKYWLWCKDNNGGYIDGAGKYKKDWDGSGSWTQVTGDLDFKIYLGTGVSAINNVVVYGTVKANSITNSKICGDAYYQSIDSSSANFLANPTNPTCSDPLTPGTEYSNQPDPPVSSMPISDANIAQWKTEAQNGGTVSGDYNLTNNTILGSKEITGNLNMTSSNKTLTITGIIYVHGNIDIDNGSTIKCDSSFGVSSCLILADGWIHIANNSQFQGSGTSGSYIMLLSTLQCDGSSLTSPDGKACGHHNGAIDLHNNATGAVFYASRGLAKLHNGVNITELTAYKIDLDNNATVSYEQGLQNANFSSGPGGSWEFSPGSYSVSN